MAHTIPFPASDSDRAPLESAFLDCERLDVYRVAVEFQITAAAIGSNRRIGPTLRDQLDRASVSIVLNVAEGAGRRTLRDKANLFTIARGSATECAAILGLLEARGALTAAAHRHGRGQLVRIVQMLTRLIARATVRRDT
jgi:four helix bundle protein